MQAEVRGKDMEDEIPPLRDKLSEMKKCEGVTVMESSLINSLQNDVTHKE